jgi:hypothetical protein
MMKSSVLIMATLLSCTSSWAAGAQAVPATRILQPPKVVDAAEDWKGSSEPSEISFGALAGLGVIDSSGGFAIIPSISKKIIDRGFVPDVNDSVWIEAEVGPVFFSGATALFFSGHLRWDFIKDQDWTFYALGGASGDVTSSGLGNHFQMGLRFGVGALWQMTPYLKLRGELSHELIVVGVDFPF